MDIRNRYGEKVIVGRLPEGYNDSDVKDEADWNRESKRRKFLFELLEQQWDANGRDRNFEVVYVTHSSVIESVLRLSE